MRTTVSVVVPTFNRLHRLTRVLTSLATQTVEPDSYEIVVVSDGSTDGTDQQVPRMKFPYRLVFETQANSGPGAARNRGVAMACGDLILFVDDDVVADPDLIAQHLGAHDDSGRTVVIGPMVTPIDHRPGPYVEWEQAMLYKQYEAMARGDYAATYRQFYTGNASIGRRFLLEAGGFDERFRRAEDVELSYRLDRLGARFLYNEKAIGFHYAERTFRSWIGIARDYGKNDIRFRRDRGEPERLQWLRSEFESRHPVIRWLTRCCLGQPSAESSARLAVRAAASAAHALRCKSASRAMLSALYNMTYYCGMADELGGSGRFYDFLNTESSEKGASRIQRPFSGRS